VTSRLGPVEIGAREIYDAVMATRGAIDRLVERHDEVARDVADHESRIRGLESSRWPLPSMAMLLSIGALLLSLLRPGS